MSSPLAWHFHVGAHKTATTHLQDTLANARAELSTAGIDYIPREHMRAMRPRKLWRMVRPARFDYWFWRRSLDRTIASIGSGNALVTISEENMIGGTLDLLTAPLYPNAAVMLRRLEELAQTSKVTVFLSIRRFDEVIPAAYAQSLKSSRNRPLAIRHGFEPIRARAAQLPPSWLDLVKRLKTSLPSVDLKVWRFEDFVAHGDEVMTFFCGAKVEWPAIPVPNSTRTPSAVAIAKLESLDINVSRQRYRSAVEKILDEDVGHSKFQPFTEDERKRLGQAYLKDIEDLKAQFPGILFEPGSNG